MKYPWFKFFITDWDNDAQTLTTTQDGAYFRLIRAYYRTRKPLPTDHTILRRMTGCLKSWETLAMSEMLERFFVRGHDCWIHIRVEQELNKQSKLRSKSDDSQTTVCRKVRMPEPVSNQQNDSTEVRRQKTEESKSTPIARAPRSPGFDASLIDLPEWIPKPSWAEWCQHRKQIKKPLSELSARKCIAKLDEFRKQGHASRDVIDNAVANGWQGLFAPSKQIKKQAVRVLTLEEIREREKARVM
jgi:uncharacterized protein YdaU (DUF1376 family)